MFANYQLPVWDDELMVDDPVAKAATRPQQANLPVHGAFSVAVGEMDPTKGVPGASGTPFLLPSQLAILDQRAQGQYALDNPSSGNELLVIIGLAVAGYFLIKE